MKLGMISGYSDAAFDSVKGRGLEFIEICCNDDNDCNKVIENKDSIKANIQRTGIPVLSMGRWNHGINVGGKLDGASLDLYLKTLDTAIDLGADVFVCGCNEDTSVSKFKNYTAAIELFGTLMERKGDSNIKIAIENCDWNNFVVRPADWDIVIGEVPGLMIKYDCSHSYNRGDDYLREMSDYGDKIAHFHIKGTTHCGGGRHVDDPPAGMDDLKWGSIFSILYARKYTGGLSIEPHSRTWWGELGSAGITFTQNYIKQFIIG